MSNYVFLIDAQKTPMNPIHPAQARKLLEQGKAAVFRRYPFTLILKRTIDNPVVHALTLKIGPGSKVTGFALVTDRTGTGGQTKYNRTRLGLPKTHWLDAACVGITETLQVLTKRILNVKATGNGCRKRCQTDKYGYPVKHRPLRPIFGFCTGDIVRANVPLGKYQGTFTARVCPMSDGRGEFVINKKRFSVRLNYCKAVHRKDGYIYA